MYVIGTKIIWDDCLAEWLTVSTDNNVSGSSVLIEIHNKADSREIVFFMWRLVWTMLTMIGWIEKLVVMTATSPLFLVLLLAETFFFFFC